MSKAGISEERQTVFGDHVTQLNETVSDAGLVGEFDSGDLLENRYDPYAMQDEWVEKYPDFWGYNCRITAFSLFGDFVEVPIDGEVRDEMVVMDLYSLSEDDSALIKKGDMERFSVLYSTIPTGGTMELDTHVANLQADWTSRGIAFKGNELYFIEKISFQEPYQVTVFYNRTELSDYLMTKYDINEGQTSAPPFIMENNQLMKGYQNETSK